MEVSTLLFTETHSTGAPRPREIGHVGTQKSFRQQVAHLGDVVTILNFGDSPGSNPGLLHGLGSIIELLRCFLQL